MTAGVLVPVDEYLNAVFHPDCDFLEGRLVERNLGEINHGEVQTCCVVYIRTHCKKFWAVVEVRVQVRPDRFRVPDVCIVAGGRPEGRVIVSPPSVVVEVLSPEDRMSEMHTRIQDYLAFGIPCVWVIDPETRRANIYTAEGSREVKDGVLRDALGEIEVPLSALFSE